MTCLMGMFVAAIATIHAPHWGYLIEREITVTNRDGSEELVRSGDLFY